MRGAEADDVRDEKSDLVTSNEAGEQSEHCGRICRGKGGAR